MFDAPAYASYIALCRELRLEREWRVGDYCGVMLPAGAVFIECLTELKMAQFNEPGIYTVRGWTTWWLPLLHQLLAMVTAAAAVSIRLWRDGEVYGVEVIVPGIGSPSETAPSWEEAAARTWCAVTGRAVTV